MPRPTHILVFLVLCLGTMGVPESNRFGFMEDADRSMMDSAEVGSSVPDWMKFVFVFLGLITATGFFAYITFLLVDVKPERDLEKDREVEIEPVTIPTTILLIFITCIVFTAVVFLIHPNASGNLLMEETDVELSKLEISAKDDEMDSLLALITSLFLVLALALFTVVFSRFLFKLCIIYHYRPVNAEPQIDQMA